MKGVITIAGYGTRFLPASKAIPKEMFPIAGVPLLQYHVESMVAAIPARKKPRRPAGRICTARIR